MWPKSFGSPQTLSAGTEISPLGCLPPAKLHFFSETSPAARQEPELFQCEKSRQKTNFFSLESQFPMQYLLCLPVLPKAIFFFFPST